MESSKETVDTSKLDASYLKKLDMSTEELGRFEKAMADPKFVQLLSDYAKEMEDPKLREENEQYLRQLEREGQGGASYGKDTELVAPNTGFCVKTKNKNTGAKAFINVCHSDKIAAATSTVRSDGSGSDWSIPYSLSTARTEKDKAGKDCEAHDFVIASTTFERCQADRRFKTFVVETALDSVEAQRQCRLDRSFTLPKLKLKGPGDRPPVLAVKANPAKLPGDTTPQDSPVSPLQPSKQLNGARSAFTFDRVSKGPFRKAHPTEKSAFAQPIREDSTLLNLEGPEEHCNEPEVGGSVFAEAAPPGRNIVEVATASNEGDGLETQPKFDIVQQGVMDLSSFWLDERAEAPRLSRPESLLFRVELPLLASAAAVELDVSEQRVVLRASGKYHLDVSLPYPVEESKGRAKFDKVRRRLEVVLPVVRPPMLPRMPFEEPQSTDQDENEGEDCRELRQATPATSDPVTAAFESPQIMPVAMSDGIMGESERRVSDKSGNGHSGTFDVETSIGASEGQSVENTAKAEAVTEKDSGLLSANEPPDLTEKETSGELESELTDRQGSPSLDTIAHMALSGQSQENGGVDGDKARFVIESPVVEETGECIEGAKGVGTTRGAKSATEREGIADAQNVAPALEEPEGGTAANARAAPKIEKPRLVPKLTCGLAYDID